MTMKLLAFVIASTLAVGCESKSMLEGPVAGAKTSSSATGTGGGTAKLVETLRSIDERVRALETAHTPGISKGDLSAFERLHRIEASLKRREESLGFLDLAYAQQKRQEEMKEAQEMDPGGVYAVDISKAIKAGQVEGPNSAIITIVEAWDFA
jgi:hypothetical protein